MSVAHVLQLFGLYNIADTACIQFSITIFNSCVCAITDYWVLINARLVPRQIHGGPDLPVFIFSNPFVE